MVRERRSHVRVRKGLRVFWDEGEVRCSGLTLDICPGGLFLITTMQLPLKSRLKLEIWPDDCRDPVRCRAEIVWVNRGQLDSFPPGFGLRFLDVDGIARSLMGLLCS